MEKLLIKSRINYHKILIVFVVLLLILKTYFDIKESNTIYSYISELERKFKLKNSDICNKTILFKKDNRYFLLDKKDYDKIDSVFKVPPKVNNLIKLE
jgi:hypothetical protein